MFLEDESRKFIKNDFLFFINSSYISRLFFNLPLSRIKKYHRIIISKFILVLDQWIKYLFLKFLYRFLFDFLTCIINKYMT